MSDSALRIVGSRRRGYQQYETNNTTNLRKRGANPLKTVQIKANNTVAIIKWYMQVSHARMQMCSERMNR